jgi:Baseplate J-like protein
MIDPGHPFTVPYADVIAALEDRLRNGTEQSAQWQFVFQSARTTYELPRDASAITTVSGFVGQTYTEFERDVHYRLASNRLVWLDPDVRPRDVSRVDVEYTYNERPSGLTDFNEGSVAGTLIRAVARELKVVYEQMDQAYRRAFIDVATGSALDSVVALLGIIRNPAIKARGPVTYVRRTATNREVVIPASQRVAAPVGHTFVTLTAAVIPSSATSSDPTSAASCGPPTRSRPWWASGRATTTRTPMTRSRQSRRRRTTRSGRTSARSPSRRRSPPGSCDSATSRRA